MTTRRRGPGRRPANPLSPRILAFFSLAALLVVGGTGLVAPAPKVRATGSTTTRLSRAVVPKGWSSRLATPAHEPLIGFTWAGAAAGALSVRTHTPAGWTGWTSIDGAPAEGPDRSSREYHGHTSAGPIWVGRDADRVDVRVDQGPLADFKVITVDAAVNASPGSISSATATPAQPAIHPRTDWGQPEDWQKNHDGCDNPDYASTVRYAVVHHTVNANSYSPADVPALINGIWRFHVFTNGWCDIGYNFLIDRFGGVWEGRAGGITKAVVGAHAGGFNTASVGVSLIGNFDAGSVPGAMYSTLVQTIAWKLALHGANPTGQLTVTPAEFDQSRYPAGQPVLLWTVIGHRDVDSTECPGGLAYGLIDRLRIDVQKTMAAAQSPDGTNGYWLVASDGGIFAYGRAGFFGSTGGMRLNQPIVGMAATPTGKGYWLVASDGGIFAYGDAGFYGSTGSMRLNKPIVGMASTKSGRGYWLVASDGGIFSFGDAAFQGSMGGSPLNQPVVGMAADEATGGYWLVASDGGIFSFNAPFYGSTGTMRLAQPITGMTAMTDGRGYQFVAGDGGLFSFGDAPFAGSAAGGVVGRRVVGMAVDRVEGGYRMVGRDGALFSFGAARFFGSAANIALNFPIVGMASWTAPPPPPPGPTPLPLP